MNISKESILKRYGMSINGKSKLYHGTCFPHDKIDLNKSNEFKDFGRGYYLTSYKKQAESWAKRRGESRGTCWVYEYTLSDSHIQNLQILEFLEYNEEWLKFITRNRKYGKCPVYDIIYDRMADNQCATLSATIDRYAERTITSESALKQIRFKDCQERDQYCFKTQAAIVMLQRTASIEYTMVNGSWVSKS